MVGPTGSYSPKSRTPKSAGSPEIRGPLDLLRTVDLRGPLKSLNFYLTRFVRTLCYLC